MVPVSAVIKVCALDASFLEVTVPHMLRQASYPFAEVLLLADPRAVFTGKYASRRAASSAAYRQVLDRLQQSGVVTRVVWADGQREDIQRVLARYFRDPVEAAWSHDVTGAPVYSALLGLELARHDRVLHMDADMLFHGSGRSWVAEGLRQLDADAALWFIMTHAGPPAAALGTAASLGPGNQGRASWDAARALWLFRHVSSRYFLCDRRRLRGKLPVVLEHAGLAPLETCFSAALERESAFRANLALEGSWDLHLADHRPPFPGWALCIARLVERGIVPVAQRGVYDLNLRRDVLRIPWQALLRRECACARHA